VIFPALTAVKSNNAAPHEQGAVQGAIFGARSVAMGVGPLFFAALFALFTKTPEQRSQLPFLPQAPFIAALGLIAIGLLLALSLPKSATSTGAVPVVSEAGQGSDGHADTRGGPVTDSPGAAGAGEGGAGIGRRGRFWERAGGREKGADELLRAPLLPSAVVEEEDEVEEEEAGAEAAGIRAATAVAEAAAQQSQARRAAAGARQHGLLEGDVEAGDGRHLLKPE
jgi:hypothetical protein